MTKRKTRKASWLLTVASAYSVLPGCSDDSSAGKPDANMASYDGGVTVMPPQKSDAAAATDGGNDAAGSDEIDAGEEELDFPTLIGVIIFPPGNGNLPELDAGSTDAPSADDASAPGDGPLITGLVALPPVVSPGARAASVGSLDRPLPKT